MDQSSAVGMVTEMVQSIVVAIDDIELVRNVGYLIQFKRLTGSATVSELFNLAQTLTQLVIDNFTTTRTDPVLQFGWMI